MGASKHHFRRRKAPKSSILPQSSHETPRSAKTHGPIEPMEGYGPFALLDSIMRFVFRRR